MRLFTGIGLPPEVRARAASLIETLRPTADFKWSTPENLHITVKFIGEWPEHKLSEITDRLRELAAPSPIKIAVRNVSWFPNPQSPRMLWASIDAPGQLAELAHRTDSALADLGVARETKAFNPHLTLARVPPGATLTAIRPAAAQFESIDLGEFQADNFVLFLSKTTPRGALYTVLEQFSL